MEFYGRDVKDAFSKALGRSSGSLDQRRRNCVHMWNKVQTLTDQLEYLGEGIDDLHGQMEQAIRGQQMAVVDLVVDAISIIVPFIGRSRKVYRILVALRRAIRGGRMSHVMQELRDFFDLLSDVQSALDNINSIIQTDRRLDFLQRKVTELRNDVHRMRSTKQGLELEHSRLDCDNLPEAEEGEGGFVGVSYGQGKRKGWKAII